MELKYKLARVAIIIFGILFVIQLLIPSLGILLNGPIFYILTLIGSVVSVKLPIPFPVWILIFGALVTFIFYLIGAFFDKRYNWEKGSVALIKFWIVFSLILIALYIAGFVMFTKIPNIGYIYG